MLNQFLTTKERQQVYAYLITFLRVNKKNIKNANLELSIKGKATITFKFYNPFIQHIKQGLCLPKCMK